MNANRIVFFFLIRNVLYTIELKSYLAQVSKHFELIGYCVYNITANRLWCGFGFSANCETYSNPTLWKYLLSLFRLRLFKTNLPVQICKFSSRWIFRFSLPFLVCSKTFPFYFWSFVHTPIFIQIPDILRVSCSTSVSLCLILF